jgi:hypothetical protein
VTSGELLALVASCVEQLELTGTTYEAENIKKKLVLAREQLERPYPARTALTDLCEASKAGKHMDRYQDADVIGMWLRADRALGFPFLPEMPKDEYELVFVALAGDNRGTVTVGSSQIIPVADDVVQVWRRRA